MIATGDSVLTAVLSALAGVRRGEPVAAVGTDPLTRSALFAMSEVPLVDPESAPGSASVALAAAAYDVPAAVSALGPGGRLVALAADPGAAARVSATHGLRLEHVERLGRGVAWVGRRPLAPEAVGATAP